MVETSAHASILHQMVGGAPGLGLHVGAPFAAALGAATGS